MYLLYRMGMVKNVSQGVAVHGWILIFTLFFLLEYSYRWGSAALYPSLFINDKRINSRQAADPPSELSTQTLYLGNQGGWVPCDRCDWSSQQSHSTLYSADCFPSNWGRIEMEYFSMGTEWMDQQLQISQWHRDFLFPPLSIHWYPPLQRGWRVRSGPSE